ncbi:hypothetical protein [Sulfuricystis multivorans]|uniref:hypothetical protein n=1 Tax=Sulfuricystis multivorans TaxID=2211108 RepID=UPI000F840465|nr:hypothetical protein [Sulfuricystis multivorans]
MSDKDDSSFRVHARFNRVEYADLEEDLNRYSPGADRSGRIRFLIRLGLEVSKGRIPSLPTEEQACPSQQGTRENTEQAAPMAVSPKPIHQPEPDDILDSLGIDPASFQFGSQT